MSNRDGRGAKENARKRLFRKGGLCPVCKKGRLEKCKQITNLKRKTEYLVCQHCHASNF